MGDGTDHGPPAPHRDRRHRVAVNVRPRPSPQHTSRTAGPSSTRPAAGPSDRARMGLLLWTGGVPDRCPTGHAAPRASPTAGRRLMGRTWLFAYAESVWPHRRSACPTWSVVAIASAWRMPVPPRSAWRVRMDGYGCAVTAPGLVIGQDRGCGCSRASRGGCCGWADRCRDRQCWLGWAGRRWRRPETLGSGSRCPGRGPSARDPSGQAHRRGERRHLGSCPGVAAGATGRTRQV